MFGAGAAHALIAEEGRADSARRPEDRTCARLANLAWASPSVRSSLNIRQGQHSDIARSRTKGPPRPSGGPLMPRTAFAHLPRGKRREAKQRRPYLAKSRLPSVQQSMEQPIFAYSKMLAFKAMERHHPHPRPDVHKIHHRLSLRVNAFFLCIAPLIPPLLRAPARETARFRPLRN
jgi:hypothetical protein